MSNELTVKELQALAKYEEQLQKVRKAFGGKKVKFWGDKVLVSVSGSNIEVEYSLKDVLRMIQKKERGNVGHRKTARAKKPARASTKRASIAVAGVGNAAVRAEIRAMQNRLRTLRRAEREKKKAEREAAAAGGAGAGAGAARSPSSSKNSSAGSNNNMAELVAGLGDMSVAEVRSEIARLEEALARMGL